MSWRIKLPIPIMLLLILVSTDTAMAYDAQETELLSLINEFRVQNGLSPLKLSSALSTAAEFHSLDMAQNGYFAHNSLDGRTPFNRMRFAGYNYNTVMGENLAAGYASAHATLQGWKDSTGHRAMLLKPGIVVVGIGYVYKEESNLRYYWTADFGGFDDAGQPKAITVESVSPATVNGGGAAEITIRGTGFLPQTQVTIGSIVFTTPVYVDGSCLKVTLPETAPAGLFAVRLVNPDGVFKRVADALRVKDKLSRFDLDGSGLIDLFDITFIARTMGKTKGIKGWVGAADFDNNGCIDVFDLVQVSRNFGQAC